jgi:hypothetical protein
MEPPNDLGSWFSIANSIALASWAALILLPRWPLLQAALRYGVPGLFATAYLLLVLVYFFHVEGGGFNSLAQVKALLGTEPTLLAGWLHYLAFDLFVGTWIAERADALGLSRLIQAPILVLTFLFGPIGYLVFIVAKGALRSPTSPTAEVPL